ncbi:MAG: hypothetical protein PHO02_03290 [Candidatus Nanoarchaeia archaeon]|nr:hypothetical protein [Candidatus Nanoarchaeia archaeon]
MAKKPRLGLCIALAGSMAAAGVFAFDNSYYGNQILTNSVYCNASGINFPFDRNEIRDVSIGIYFGNEIPENERRESLAAFEFAKEKYRGEFGINLVPYCRGNVEIPELTESGALADRISDADDFELVFTHKAYSNGRINDADSNLVARIVRVNPFWGDCTQYLLIHEIAHMFYAGHSEKPSSIMFPEVFCSDFQDFDEDTRDTIELYKRRFW